MKPSSTRRLRGAWPGVTGIALAAILLAAPCGAAGDSAGALTDVAVKAALLYNFAKFVEWPALRAGDPLVVCIVGDEGIAAAFTETFRGKSINDHRLDVSRPADSASWRGCHMLFIAGAELRRSAGGMGGIRTVPVLTVSDSAGFAQTGGIIELFAEAGRIRFAINVDAAERSGLLLSSRLLGLAKVRRDSDVQ